jgi:hypothetical protein
MNEYLEVQCKATRLDFIVGLITALSGIKLISLNESMFGIILMLFGIWLMSYHHRLCVMNVMSRLSFWLGMILVLVGIININVILVIIGVLILLMRF